MVQAGPKRLYFSAFSEFGCSGARSVSKNEDVTTFQGLIFALEQFWAERGCVILQPYDMEVGAGTFHPATFLRSIGPEPWKSHQGAPRTGGTVRIPIVCSITTNTR
jgi:hypothetical protein